MAILSVRFKMNSPIKQELNTFFASPERLSGDDLQKHLNLIVNDPVVKVVLQAVNGYAMILNEHRQILAGNQELLTALNLKEKEFIGERPGELFHCEHSATAPSGCGTGYNCKSCGAALAILTAQNLFKESSEECRLMMNISGEIKCLDLQVRATPFFCGDKQMIILVLQDISNAKRKDVLERVFFHDINNTLGALTGYCSLLNIKEEGQLAAKILEISNRLKEEIGFQEMLMLAEKGKLSINSCEVQVEEILEKLEDIFTEHKASEGKFIYYYPLSERISLKTDPVLLLKVLVNILKNALEATASGGTIKFFCEIQSTGIRFCVHNDGFIPETTALNIFHRSFSTKGGSGRGLGTYSMKLFGENYLKGRVGFTSNEQNGTVFYIDLPYNIE